jgi:hypothetical protein
MEVAVAGALVAILSACVFRGILTVKHNSQTVAQRIAAQGVCLHRYEEMKSVAWENIDDASFPTATVLLAALNKDPAKGRLEAVVSNSIALDVRDGVQMWKVDITCTWTFRGRTRSEALHGMIVNGYSTYAESGNLSGTINLNPNFERPVLFYAKSTDGEVYTQSNLSSMPSSFEATTLVMKPGGRGDQSVLFDGGSRRLSNDKVVAFIAGGLDHPISVSFTKTTGDTEDATGYSISFSCDKASLSYK